MKLDILQIRKKISDYINNTGLVLIGMVCLGYLLFYSFFAKVNIVIPFFNFPIFIGEMLLIVCLILFLLKFFIYPQKSTVLYTIFFNFFIFLVVKTYFGYLQWETLALRHAALFIYSLFIVIGYSFFNRPFFKNQFNLFILITTFFFVFLKNPIFNEYYFITCFILFLLLIKQCPNKILQLFLTILLLCLAPYRVLSIGPRAIRMGNYATLIFIIAVLIYKNKVIFKTMLRKLFLSKIRFFTWVILFVCLIVSVIKIKDIRNAMNIIFPRGLISGYVNNKKRISSLKDSFKMEKIPVTKIYNIGKPTATPQRAYYKQLEQLIKLDASIALNSQAKTVMSRSDKEMEKMRLNLNCNNALLRIFMWEDIFEEIAKSKLRFKIFGIDFGKPFRSKNIEILCWSGGDWGRDGWISPHNSYFEILYRAGLIGILFIIGIFLTLFKMIKKALLCNSIIGVALCAIFINWIVAANFMPLFEMPYFAIPFWSLFGMSLAYIENECVNK